MKRFFSFKATANGQTDQIYQDNISSDDHGFETNVNETAQNDSGVAQLYKVFLLNLYFV